MERPQNKDVWLVIPTFNNQSILPDVVREIDREGYSIAVIDDGSSPALPPDALGISAGPNGVFLLRHAINLGQGAAIQTGISFALRRGAQVIVTFDADGQHCLEDVPRLIEPIWSGGADAVLGSRFLPGGEARNIPRLKFLLLQAAVIFTRAVTGLRISDTHNGLRAFSRSAAAQLQLKQNRMSHATEILQRIAEKKLPYMEVPVTIRYTDYSLAHGQRLSNAFNILWDSFASLLKG